MITNTHRKYKRTRLNADGEVVEEDLDDIPSNLVVQFTDREGSEVGEALDVPTSAGSAELGTLIRSLLGEDDEDGNKGHIPYAFFAKVTKKVSAVNPTTGEKEIKSHTDEVDITDYASLYEETAPQYSACFTVGAWFARGLPGRIASKPDFI